MQLTRPGDSRLITKEEAASRLGLTGLAKDPPRIVKQMVKRGELRAVHVGRWMMIDPVSVDRFIAGEA
jgi:hypothetical protein